MCEKFWTLPKNPMLAGTGLGKVECQSAFLVPENPLNVNYTTAIQQAAVPFLAVQDETAQDAQEPQKPQRKFTLLSGADVLALPMPRYIVKGLIPDKSIVVFYGQSATGKTYVILSLGLAIAEGGQWFGLSTQCREVVYVYLESCGGLQKRLTAWELDNKSTTPKNIRFVIEPFHIIDDIEILAPDIPQEAVVVIDTLNVAASGLDENSSRDMSMIINACKKLQRLINGLVILVHHMGKDTARGMRGHSSLFGALDAAFEVGRNGDARYWKVTKAKENEDGMRRGFRLKSVGIGYDGDGEVETSCVVEPVDTVQGEEKPLTPALAYCLESLERALKDTGKTSIHIDEWRPVFYREHTAPTEKAKEKAFLRARNSLKDAGCITVSDNFYSMQTARQTADRQQTGDKPKIDVTADRRRHIPLGMSACLHADGGPSYE